MIVVKKKMLTLLIVCSAINTKASISGIYLCLYQPILQQFMQINGNIIHPEKLKK